MDHMVERAGDIFEKDGDGGLSMGELEQVFAENETLLHHLILLDLPRGFCISDLHLIFDEEYEGLVTKDEYLNGMMRLIFGNEFQRSCCLQLTAAQIKKE